MESEFTTSSVGGGSNLCDFSNLSIGDESTNAATGEGSASTVFITISTSLLSLLIVVGNGLIIVSVALVKKLRQPANYLIVSLALSDFLVGLVVLPLTIVYDIVGGWVFGPMMCDIHVSFDVICCTASIMNLCMISIDRYLMITKPMTYPKRRTGKLMLLLIATAWIISCLIIIPALFGFTENVKDEPHWISIQPQDILCESDGQRTKDFTASSKSLLDGNSSTFWDPTANSNASSSSDWFFVLDLGQIYQLTSVAVTNAGDTIHDVKELDLQNCVSKKPSLWETVQSVTLLPATEKRQESTLNNLQLKVLRVNVTETYNNSIQPHLREFSVFGEKAYGKTCLISQEVWFTIYSTVGAFYLPLCVMLCMYWKIYLEASKFNARHQFRSAAYGGSQEWSATPPSTPDALKRGNSRDHMRYITSNNNHANAGEKALCARVSECYDTDSDEKLLTTSNGSNARHVAVDLTVIVTRAFDSDRSDNVFEDDTLSSDCDFIAAEKDAKRDDISEITADTECISRRSSAKNVFQFSNGDVATRANGYHVAMEASPRARQRAQSASNFDGLGPIQKKVKCQTSTLSSRAESAGNGIDSVGWRFAEKPSESSASSYLGQSFASQDNSIAGDTRSRGDVMLLNGSRDFYTRPTRTTYTRTSTLSLAKSQEQTKNKTLRLNKPRHSIFSGSSGCCPRPQFRRLPSSPGSHPGSGSIRIGNGRNGIVHSKGNETTPALSRRRSTVFHQIRRRVSLATSRDRMRNVKATRTLGIIVGAFTFCWLPFFIVTILRPLVCEHPESQDCIPLWLVRLVLWLGYLNSALNPVIYIGFSPDLRETFRLLVCCKCTNVDRRLAQTELRQAYARERRESSMSRGYPAAESIM